MFKEILTFSLLIMAVVALSQASLIMSSAKGDTVIYMDNVVNVNKGNNSYDETDHAASGLATGGAEFSKYLDTSTGESESAVKSKGNALLYDAQSSTHVKTAPTNQCGLSSAKDIDKLTSGSGSTQTSNFVGNNADFYTSGKPGTLYNVEMSGNGIGDIGHSEWSFKGTSMLNQSTSRLMGVGNMTLKRSVKISP